MTKGESMQQYDAIVVGGGVVGGAMALALAHRFPDQRFALVEKQAPAALTTPSTLADFDRRVLALNAASQTLLAGLSLWSQLPADRVCA